MVKNLKQFRNLARNKEIHHVFILSSPIVVFISKLITIKCIKINNVKKRKWYLIRIERPRKIPESKELIYKLPLFLYIFKTKKRPIKKKEKPKFSEDVRPCINGENQNKKIKIFENILLIL